jgi:hypothetical protein
MRSFPLIALARVTVLGSAAGIVCAGLLLAGLTPRAGGVTQPALHQSYAPVALAARAMTVHETANMHLVSHRGTKILQEEGQASGTLHGRITATIDIGYSEATVSFTARSSSGALSGHGEESYYVSGKIGHFKGNMTVTGGTGIYAHAVGSSLRTTGLIKRAHYEAQMTVDGELRS